MIIIEKLYNLKKNVVKYWKMYFTIEGTYTSLLPDRIYLKKLYKKRMGEELNLKAPKSYTEKLNWLKLHDRNPAYTLMVDKFGVREYISEKIGEEYLVPLIGSWSSVEDIDFTQLPNEFVLKCNHDNGIIVCNNKENLDVDNVKKELQFHLNRDYYKKAREWPYKNVDRKIICEQFMKNTDGDPLVDYKLFCFNGVPRFVMVNSDRFSKDTKLKTDIYDMEWNYMNMQDGPYPMAGDVFEKPECLEEMRFLAEKLSKGIPFVRVDFNYWNKQLYFGELTFYHSAGFESFQPKEWDNKLGEWLKLPTKNSR